MIDTGKLQHKVSLQRFETVVDPETGHREQIWKEIASPWVAIEPISGREFLAAAAERAEVTTRITMYYRADVTAAARIVYRGKVYNIKAALPDPDTGLEWLTLMCTEGSNDG